MTQLFAFYTVTEHSCQKLLYISCVSAETSACVKTPLSLTHHNTPHLRCNQALTSTDKFLLGSAKKMMKQGLKIMQLQSLFRNHSIDHITPYILLPDPSHHHIVSHNLSQYSSHHHINPHNLSQYSSHYFSHFFTVLNNKLILTFYHSTHHTAPYILFQYPLHHTASHILSQYSYQINPPIL